RNGRATEGRGPRVVAKAQDGPEWSAGGARGLTLYRDADEYPFRRSVARHGRSSPETYSLLMPAIRARSPSSASCPDLLMRRRRVDEAADSRTGPRRPRKGYGGNIPAHTQYQGGLPNRLPGVNDRGNSRRRVPRRHNPTISYPCDKNTHQNNTPSGEHSENI
ncbi:hypothetical protein THAOC_09120, partial [Thalassiosira oceanica]